MITGFKEPTSPCYLLYHVRSVHVCKPSFVPGAGKVAIRPILDTWHISWLIWRILSRYSDQSLPLKRWELQAADMQVLPLHIKQQGRFVRGERQRVQRDRQHTEPSRCPHPHGGLGLRVRQALLCCTVPASSISDIKAIQHSTFSRRGNPSELLTSASEAPQNTQKNKEQWNSPYFQTLYQFHKWVFSCIHNLFCR